MENTIEKAEMAKKRAAPDEILMEIADYVCNTEIHSEEAYNTARLCLADTLGCAVLALQFPECTKLLGPAFEGVTVENGCRVPGLPYRLDPIAGAFTIGTMIRWLDFNDTWLAAEWGHPSDNFGGILAVADWLAQRGHKLSMRDVLTAAIKAYEIQGVIALKNSFNRIGFDHVILVKVATAAVVARMLGASKEQVFDTLTHAWIDTGPLRTYRHAPNTGSRKSWAAGDATSRGVWLARNVLRGEMGYPSALSAERWGFYDVLFDGQPFVFEQAFGSYVMENILFKISFPAEFHAQTAVEAAIRLHPSVKGRLKEISSIQIETHESAVRIIDKKGPLHNPADRDHCLQYMTAIGLLKGALVAEDYEDDVAADPQVDALREKMVVTEVPQYTKDYLDPSKRSIANAVQVHFVDGSCTEKIEVEYPVGHRRRRAEGTPLLFEKLRHNLGTHYEAERVHALCSLFEDQQKLEQLDVAEFMGLV